MRMLCAAMILTAELTVTEVESGTTITKATRLVDNMQLHFASYRETTTTTPRSLKQCKETKRHDTTRTDKQTRASLKQRSKFVVRLFCSTFPNTGAENTQILSRINKQQLPNLPALCVIIHMDLIGSTERRGRQVRRFEKR
ncbi:hypothetical protein T01_8477 [Trichinella spiralis]|uniref:Secreted protein n=1 Tax=Trichinella spiralis TaxID=6334 RepID=A0A0V1BPR1_TRISP|nr:hypothetical protein T01_8477 [Trichinella spiralis]